MLEFVGSYPGLFQNGVRLGQRALPLAGGDGLSTRMFRAFWLTVRGRRFALVEISELGEKL